MTLTELFNKYEYFLYSPRLKEDGKRFMLSGLRDKILQIYQYQGKTFELSKQLFSAEILRIQKRNK